MGIVCNCSDDEAVLRLFVGLPMLGWAPDARGLMKRCRPPDCAISDWLCDREARNFRILRGIRSSGDADLDIKAYQKTLDEVRQGALKARSTTSAASPSRTLALPHASVSGKTMGRRMTRA